jgi:hypothetical protein
MVQGYTPKNCNDEEDRDERELTACVHALKHSRVSSTSVWSACDQGRNNHRPLTLSQDAPTFENLDLAASCCAYIFEGVVKLSLMLAIVDMLRVNAEIQEITLDQFSYEEEARMHDDELIRPLFLRRIGSGAFVLSLMRGTMEADASPYHLHDIKPDCQ